MMDVGELPDGVVLFDSLGDLQPNNTSPILVCGSHCGGSMDLARQVRNCHITAAFLNNAGIGKNQAGVRGLEQYQAQNILACAVDHNSAEIGVARDTWESGIISHTNILAQEAGFLVGESVKKAVSKIAFARNLGSLAQSFEKPGSLSNQENDKNKVNLKKQTQTQVAGVNVTVTDSITFLNENNGGDVVVCGSHGGLSAGHYAQKYHVKAVFFNDAGIGKNDAGVKGLQLLNDAGIIACAVSCWSAEIFNGQDSLNNGIITVCNQLATSIFIKEKMTVTEAINRISARE